MLTIQQNKKKKLGFSLIELLVVISIIATLTALLMANFMGARERARDTQKVVDLNSVKDALRMYYNDNQSYPPDKDAADAGLVKYLPGISEISYDYYSSSPYDQFDLCTYLEAGVGNDDIASQTKCGGKITPSNPICGVGVTTDKLFVVCGK